MKIKVTIDTNTDAGKKVQEIIRKMIENQQNFREAVQSGQMLPKPQTDAQPV